MVAQFVRFNPASWSGNVPCMRVEVFNATVAPAGMNQVYFFLESSIYSFSIYSIAATIF